MIPLLRWSPALGVTEGQSVSVLRGTQSPLEPYGGAAQEQAGAWEGFARLLSSYDLLGDKKTAAKGLCPCQLPDNGTDFSSLLRGELSSKGGEVSLPFHEGVGSGEAGET